MRINFKGIKKTLKILLYFFLFLLALPGMLYSVLQISFVQNYITHRMASYLSEKLHTEVSIGGVDINIMFDVILEDVKINDQHQKPIIDAKYLMLDMNDIFYEEQGISLDKIVLEDAKVRLVKYKNEKYLNYKFIQDYFSSEDTTTSGGQGWKIKIGSLVLINNNFIYLDENASPQEKGINFSNLDISSLNVHFNNVYLCGDTITAGIRKMSMTDRSGFILKSLSADALISSTGIDLQNLKITTQKSNLSLHLKFTYNDYNDFNDFITKVQMDALLKPSKLFLNDLAYFAPDLYGMTDIVGICGEIKGKVANLKGKKFQFLYGDGTYFLGDFNVSGLPDVEGTYIHFNVKNFKTCQYDIAAFSLPESAGMKHIELPVELIRLGNIGFKGAFTGFYNDFVAYGNFYTEMGNVSTDITLRNNKTTGLIEYDGKVEALNLNIGKILDVQDELGLISMNANVTGAGFDAENATVKMDGTINAIDFRNYHYTNIELEGDLERKKFNGYMKINNENVKLDFTGMVDYSGELPVFNVASRIENLKLSKLHFLDIEGDSLSSLSTELELNFEGDDIDNIQGSISAENTSYTYKGEKYFLSSFKFVNTAEKSGKKSLTINSDYFDADISGSFMFNNLYLSSLKFIKVYLPSYSSWITENLDSIPEQNFVYFIKLKNTLPLCKLFMPELTVSPNTILKGSYNTNQSLLDLSITSANAEYSDYKFKDFFISGKTKDSKIHVNVGCQKINFSDTLGLDNVTLASITKNDSIRYQLTWENNDDQIKNSGDIKGFFSLSMRPKLELKFLDAKLVINDTTWSVDPANVIFFDSSSVAIQNLIFSTKHQKVKIDGSISENPAELLHLNFDGFNVSNLDMLYSSSGVDIDGYLNGFVDISNVYHSLNIISNLTINDFYVNNDKLGKAVVIINWNDAQKAALIDADIIYEGATGSNNPISVSGSYYPERDTTNFDIDISLTNFKLKLLEKYMKSFCSSFKGFATGKLKLKGTPAEPDLNGHVYLVVKGMKIDYLNENYSFTDSIIVTKNSFSFDHLVLNDAFGDTAVCDGKITHHNFNDMNLDVTIKTYNLQCLNTDASMNSLFYGKAWATGVVKITGDVDNINMDIDAKTEKGTRFYIPITSDEEISDNDYIHFVTKHSDTIRDENYKVDLAGMTLNFGLDVTPDADVQIIFDSKIGDIIKARGSGNIRMEITTLGDFNMYGDYVIDEGDYLFTLKNVINKKFIIQKGSSLKWNGSPYDAIADITAIYPVKASLNDLVISAGDSSSSEEYNKLIPVDCLLGMKDKIFNPAITFDIDLPKSDESTKTLVKTLINNEQEMNKQIFSLLVLNRFMPLEKIQYTAISSGLGSTSTELLSNQLSNWLSQISKKFDIGVNYRPGSEITSEEVEVALSTQFMDDKLIIDGNVVASGGTQKSSNIVGDVNIEYKLTERLHVKGFNKSNTIDLVNSNAPYTQGLGIFYRREFDTLGDWLKKKKK
ncbi:MAG: translocation/assembly module TamB domain-containing protein [Bacteroidota bacterium]